MRRLALLLSVAAGLAFPAAAQAAPVLSKIGDFVSPTHVASPPGDPRLFVVEQAGRVKVVSGGTVKPFLDVTGITSDGGNEQGLLSIAFPPDYAASGLSYVFLTGAGGALEVYEHRRSADPDVADPASRRRVISIPHTEAVNHNGGQLQFGPDGYLYIGTGDGGNSNDTPNPDAESTGSLLGKILRIDPRGATDGAYAVPADNPFGAVWAYGLRNPWRFSFDRATGDLAIADVGQGHREEIDFAPAAAGRGRGVNYGWRCYEGKIATPANTRPDAAETPTLCNGGEFPSNATPPVIDFTHVGDGFCSITGGYVVRDPELPSLLGRYVYADYCGGRLRSLVLPDPSSDADACTPVTEVTSFGEDAAGHVYVARRPGAVYRLVEGPANACFPATTPGGQPQQPGAAGDTRAPSVRARVSGRRTLVPRRRLRVAVTTDEPATVRVAGRLRGVGAFRTARRQLAAGRRTVVRVRISRTTARELRRTLRRKRVVAALTIVARDAAGNRRRVSRRIAIPRR